MASTPMFDHEKLDVYQLELKFLTWLTQFLVDIAGPSETQRRELITQLNENELGVMQPFEDERINR
jgi:hypothetical protein